MVNPLPMHQILLLLVLLPVLLAVAVKQLPFCVGDIVNDTITANAVAALDQLLSIRRSVLSCLQWFRVQGLGFRV
jgi:hypothetical protein